MNIRVPFDEGYVRLVGIAVYLFAYYEWVIIYIVERLEPGFVAEYCRKRTMTSRAVYDRLKDALNQDTGGHGVDKTAMECCRDEFDDLVGRRNALIHAHPITDIDGAQILNYQGKLSKPISDKEWRAEDIKGFIEEVDAAACRVNNLLHRFKS